MPSMLAVARRFSLAACLTFAGLPVAVAQDQTHTQNTQTNSDEAREADMFAFRQHDTTLSNVFFEGRAPGTRGNLLAADYLEFHFRRIGLLPAFPKDVEVSGATKVAERSTYRQPFQQGTTLKVADEMASYSVNDKTTVLRSGSDYVTLAFAGAAEATGTPVFTGYAIEEGDKGYKGFPEGTDLSGKIAIVLRFEPMNAEGKSLWVDQRWSPAASLEPKLKSLADHKAAGIILVNPPGVDDPRATKLETLTSVRPLRDGLSIPVVMMSIDQADALVRAADSQGRSLMELRRLADAGAAVVDLPKAKVSLRTKLERSPVMTDNVGAILEGHGALKDQFIVIGAHYDHVGYGYFSSMSNAVGQIHPGADDNASGTSAMLVVAQKLADRYAKLPADASARSILFLGFSAEESGLVGSRFYTNHPIMPKERHDLMINLDMVGRLRDGRLELDGVGTGKGLNDWVDPYLKAYDWNVALKPGGSGPSDHASFYSWGVPVLFFFTLLHEQYHNPTDVASLINNEGAAQIIDVVDRLAYDTALRAEGFPYEGSSQPQADQGDRPSGPRRSGVTFGIRPGDYSGTEPGVLVGGVTDGSPAAKAGLKEGDLMIKWNGTDIKSVEEWMPLLMAGKPGDEVTVTFRRDGKEMEAKGTLAARARGGQ
ncbi:MAG: M28 family peptidase [Phycisphaerales bacterium]